jgi:hypothetical protein
VEFSTPVQTGSGALPASYTVDTRSFPGVKRPAHGINHTPPSYTKVKERVELYLYDPPLCLHGRLYVEHYYIVCTDECPVCYIAHSHIHKLHVCCIDFTMIRWLRVPLTVISTCAPYKPLHCNHCVPSSYKVGHPCCVQILMKLGRYTCVLSVL